MRRTAERAKAAFKAARSLGSRQVGWYALYQAGLRGGIYKRLTPPGEYRPLEIPIDAPFMLPAPEALREVLRGEQEALVAEADEITAGQARLFGGPPAPIQLAPPQHLKHWSEPSAHAEDVKLTWEPARFGFTYTLGRAYALTGGEQYPAAFWHYFEEFLTANPPNLGLNWESGQEVALRLISWLFATRVFAASTHSTPRRMARLAGAAAAHAQRIGPTLAYARAQHNNHLVSEGLGLYLAGISLTGHPKAARWREQGFKTLCGALRAQIAPGGVYAQHSLNYHRLMLHAALLGMLGGRPYPERVRARLAAASRWLAGQVDRRSGRAPNYGSNDGANILPLAAGGFADFRPTAQAAARAFLAQSAFPPGPWDELCLWLGIDRTPPTQAAWMASPAVLRAGDEDEWAILRAVHYNSRPSQADQLHLDLWAGGEPVTLDAGTFRYSDPTPWDNALGGTGAHNTLTIDGRDQMTRAGRFLWLDWAQATVLEREPDRVAAQHDGYRDLGLTHSRAVERASPGQWIITDTVSGTGGGAEHRFVLHWLLPDLPYRLESSRLTLTRPSGQQITVEIHAPGGLPCAISLARAGELLAGEGEAGPTWGWHSPAYNFKLPALSLRASVTTRAPLRLVTRIQLG